jgi:hypothetical protein
MSQRRWLVLVILCVLGAGDKQAPARIREAWSDQQIADRSDLIVMAKAIEVRDTGIQTTVPNIKRGNDSVGAIEMETTFEISAVLKGKIEQARLVFCHLREVKTEVASRGAAELVAFDPDGKKTYLLFLKRDADGRYSAVVGQTDPADAVREVSRAAPADHVGWIARAMHEIQGLKPGMSRAELLKVVSEEGGLSTRTARRFAFRECPYIKVNVEFKAVGEPDDAAGTASSHDEITRVSAPFLEWSIAD